MKQGIFHYSKEYWLIYLHNLETDFFDICAYYLRPGLDMLSYEYASWNFLVYIDLGNDAALLNIMEKS